MELMFIGLAGVIIGLAGRYVLPNRQRHGVALLPGVGAAAAMILWEALTWAGLKWDGGWIWWIALFGTGAVVLVVDLLLGSVRKRRDDALEAHVLRNGLQPA